MSPGIFPFFSKFGNFSLKWYPGAYFHYLKILIFQVFEGYIKEQKLPQNDKEFCMSHSVSQELYIIQALANCVCVSVTYLKSKNLQIAVLDHFLTSMLTKAPFLFPRCMKIRPAYTLKHSVRQILKKKQCDMFFSFMLYVLYLMILNLVIVSKINLQWGCFLIFSYIPCKQLKLERSLTEKL